jgi:hypothetical protein
MHLVIAKYKENTDWISDLGYSYTLYNKGPVNDALHSINVPNVGRESETYLRYIVDNYNGLPDTLVFLQGNPFPHCRDLKQQILNYKKEPYYFLGNELIFDYENGQPHHPGLNIAEIAKLLGIYTDEKKYYFVPGAQFIVTAATLRSRSLSWWKNAYEVHTKFHSSPWVYERLWGDIFAV